MTRSEIDQLKDVVLTPEEDEIINCMKPEDVQKFLLFKENRT